MDIPRCPLTNFRSTKPGTDLVADPFQFTAPPLNVLFRNISRQLAALPGKM